MNIHQILTKYWGYNTFRPVQEDIIQSIMKGRDTLALLPTGGGKSICYQVPALAMEGVCIVVSPLIALMKDQVETLKGLGIQATAIFSGMHHREIDIALDNCIYGKTRLLYLSPERLSNEMVRARMMKMKVNLVAVDEAHCISQWGYDFRTAYLDIAEIRQLLPQTPLLALTATATREVVEDIQEKLLFKENNVLKQSFERKNLAYSLSRTEDKLKRLRKILSETEGSCIVYARTRKRSREIAHYLVLNKVDATFYHAGLDQTTRNTRQSSWKSGETQVMVATNAFGMGIDKPDVRCVVHMDLPNTLEAYFQEAGRCGRDGKEAHAVLLYNNTDEIMTREFLDAQYPDIKDIQSIYQALANHFQLATGAGEGVAFELNLGRFCETTQIPILQVFSAIKWLENEGYISMNEAMLIPSKVHFRMARGDLYAFQVENRALDPMIKLLLRSYVGMFDEFVKIREGELAKRASLDKKEVVQLLEKLDMLGVISYKPQNQQPQIIFTQPRIDVQLLKAAKKEYEKRKKRAFDKLNGVLNYAKSTNACRSEMLIAYFGEQNTHRCGICDVCLDRNRLELSQLEFDEVLNTIKPIITEDLVTIEELMEHIEANSEERTIKVIQWLIDNKKLKYDQEECLQWITS